MCVLFQKIQSRVALVKRYLKPSKKPSGKSKSPKKTKKNAHPFTEVIYEQFCLKHEPIVMKDVVVLHVKSTQDYLIVSSIHPCYL